MGLLPNDIELLPPCDDRVFKLLMTSPDATPALLLVSSAIVNSPVVSVLVRNNELPVTDIMSADYISEQKCRKPVHYGILPEFNQIII